MNLIFNSSSFINYLCRFPDRQA